MNFKSFQGFGRVFKVVPDGKKYRIHVRRSYDKRGKITLKEYRKYPSENSAQNTVKRLRAHIDEGKCSATFKQKFHSQWNCKNAGEVKCYRASITPVRGIVGKRLLRKQNREYSRHRKFLRSCSRASRKISTRGIGKLLRMAPRWIDCFESLPEIPLIYMQASSEEFFPLTNLLFLSLSLARSTTLRSASWF